MRRQLVCLDFLDENNNSKGLNAEVKKMCIVNSFCLFPLLFFLNPNVGDRCRTAFISEIASFTDVFGFGFFPLRVFGQMMMSVLFVS